MEQIPHFKSMRIDRVEYGLGQSGYKTVPGYEITIELDRGKLQDELDMLANPPSASDFCGRIRDSLRERLERETGLEPENITSYAPWYRNVARISLKVPPPFYESVTSVLNTMVVPPGQSHDIAPPSTYTDSGQYLATGGPYADSDNKGVDNWWKGGQEAAPDPQPHPKSQRGNTVPSISLVRMVSGLLEKKPELRVRAEEPNERELCQDMARAVVREVERSYSVKLREGQKIVRLRDATRRALREEYVTDPERLGVIAEALAKELHKTLKGASIDHTPGR